MSHTRDSLKYNRGQLKKSGGYYKNHKERYADGARAKQVDLYKATPEELQSIRAKIRLERRKERKKRALALVGSLLITLVIGWLSTLLFLEVVEQRAQPRPWLKDHEKMQVEEHSTSSQNQSR